MARNSEDKKTLNHRGLCLLDLCKSRDFLIANGRVTGDVFGKYTSFQWNGSCVVDYLISMSSILEQKIMKFHVGDFYPWLSDHCPLFYTISCKKEIEPLENGDKLSRNTPPRFTWKHSSKERYNEVLKSHSLSHRKYHQIYWFHR